MRYHSIPTTMSEIFLGQMNLDTGKKALGKLKAIQPGKSMMDRPRACCLHHTSLHKNPFQIQCFKTTITYLLTVLPFVQAGQKFLVSMWFQKGFPLKVTFIGSSTACQNIQDAVTFMSDDSAGQLKYIGALRTFLSVHIVYPVGQLIFFV